MAAIKKSVLIGENKVILWSLSRGEQDSNDRSKYHEGSNKRCCKRDSLGSIRWDENLNACVFAVASTGGNNRARMIEAGGVPMIKKHACTNLPASTMHIFTRRPRTSDMLFSRFHRRTARWKCESDDEELAWMYYVFGESPSRCTRKATRAARQTGNQARRAGPAMDAQSCSCPHSAPTCGSG
jgi:hypothetical protein